MISTFLLAALMTPLAKTSPVSLPETSLNVRNGPASLPTVTQFKYSGNGCSQGSNSVSRYGGWSTQVFGFRQFRANTLSSTSDSTQNCELHFEGSGASAGWQVSLSELDATGKLVLPPGATLNYYWQVYWSDNASDTLALRGSINPSGAIDNFQYTIAKTVAAPLWSQCIGFDGNPGILNVNFRVAIIGDGGSFEVDAETLHYQWRKC